MRDPIFFLIVVLMVITVLIFSGCISPNPPTLTPSPAGPVPSIPPSSDSSSHEGHPGVNYPPTPTVVNENYPQDPSHWIELHHIQNLNLDPGSVSPKPVFTISGDTNLPAHALIYIQTYRKDFSTETEVPVLVPNQVATVQHSNGQVNTFSYPIAPYDYDNVPIYPGEYRAVAYHEGVNDSMIFEILGKDPLPWLWIRVDPVGTHHFGDSFTIMGTTNLPANSALLVRGGTDIHPCPFIPPGQRSSYPGSICGNCPPAEFSDMIPVIPAVGNNTWNFTVDTSGWCLNESYSISISKDKWDNVSSAMVQFAGSRAEPLTIQTV